MPHHAGFPVRLGGARPVGDWGDNFIVFRSTIWQFVRRLIFDHKKTQTRMGGPGTRCTSQLSQQASLNLQCNYCHQNLNNTWLDDWILDPPVKPSSRVMCKPYTLMLPNPQCLVGLPGAVSGTASCLSPGDAGVSLRLKMEHAVHTS